MSRTRRTIYYAILFAINAIEMVLELAASRVMSPYFGSSHYVWTAVIGIILLAGCLGNLLGGRISEREGNHALLSRLLFASAVYVALICSLGSYILELVRTALPGIRVGSVLSAILLFLLPSAVLGSVSPVVMGDLLRGHSELGNTSGRIHAVMAAGSLLGTFAGGFWLLPAMGVRTVLLVLAACLMLIALYYLLEQREHLPAIFFVIALLLIMHLSAGAASTGYERGVSIDTQYGRIVIQDGTLPDGSPVRFYKQSGAYESACYLDEGRRYDLVFNYTKAYDLAFDRHADWDTTLMIGGAAYSYPKYYISHYPNRTMDVVEIDSEATEIAKRYFFLQELLDEYDTSERLGLINNDGRVYLADCGKTYDVVMNDAFSGENPVAVLSTVEATRLVKEHLRPNGWYMSNVLGSVNGPESAFLLSEIRTLREVFAHVYLLPTVEGQSGDLFGNFMMIATDEDVRFENAFDCDVSHAIVLTDDYCPVDAMVGTSYFDG